MSDAIDIQPADRTPAAQPKAAKGDPASSYGGSPANIPAHISASKHERPRGALSRFLFTLAIATAICLALITFLYILGRSTQDNGPRLNVEQRSVDTIYSDAVNIPQKALRLRALRNYITAFPEASQSTQAGPLIEALEADEYDKWLNLSDIFYTTNTSNMDKLIALHEFEAEWGAGHYIEDVKAMRAQLNLQPDEALPQTRPALAKGRAAPIAAASNIASDIATQSRLAQNIEDINEIDQFMAGAAPDIEIYKPAALLPAPPPQPVIIAAKITKDTQPIYPSRARERGIEAVVTIAMDVDAKGKVKDAYIVKPATGRYANDFGRAAIRAAQSTEFSPKTIAGEAQPTNGFTRRYRFEIGN